MDSAVTTRTGAHRWWALGALVLTVLSVAWTGRPGSATGLDRRRYWSR
jgi:hypothetical protein